VGIFDSLTNSWYHIRYGANNNSEQVKSLQLFLNENLDIKLSANGIYDKPTFDAVKTFQMKYRDDILKPWGISESTGYVYKTTRRMINNLKCFDLNLPMPILP